MIYSRTFLNALFIAIACHSGAQPTTLLTVNVDKPVAEVQPTMWGIFFEDINFAADGGLYAELVKNRSFEFDVPLMAWNEEGTDRFGMNNESGFTTILNRGATSDTNPRFARVTSNSEGSYSLTNTGFYGMGIKKGLSYALSMYIRPHDGNVYVRAELVDDQQRVIGSATIRTDDREWKRYQASITATETIKKASLKLTFIGKGSIDIDIVSLFPPDTWKNKPGGLRADLVQLLYDMKPGFLRFPGGCIVEGRDLSQRYQWKNTVGDVNDRPLLINRWNTEFRHRPTPDYFQTFGLGFYEYFELAEDLGAAPLPILSCGIACQFNTAEVVPMDQIDPYVQDALDLIEFANGDVTTKWGRLRKDMGHPAPFNLTMLGVGNEQWGPQYIERYIVFERAIKSKYPHIKIISGTGPFPDGELFDYATSELSALHAEIIDEHYYRPPLWFFENATRYDHYDRKGPKIFAGEYAAQSVAIASPENKNTWRCALSEAAFMTGLERNADVVHLASYAPLFGHAGRWQWTPDLIWFDNLSSYGTANYYVQKLFSTNAGTHVISVLNGTEKVAGQNNLYASGVWDDNRREVILKIVNANETPHTLMVKVSSKNRLDSQATATVLAGDLNAVNSFQMPTAIKPAESTVEVRRKSIQVQLPPSSLIVIKIKTM